MTVSARCNLVLPLSIFGGHTTAIIYIFIQAIIYTSSFSFARFVNQTRLLEDFLGSNQQIRSSPSHPPACIPTHLVPNSTVQNLPRAADFMGREGSTSCHKNSATVFVLTKFSPIQTVYNLFVKDLSSSHDYKYA
jgi:hypothetical protein